MTSELANHTFKVPYTFVSKQVNKPPQNGYWTSLIVRLFCIIIYSSLVSWFALKIIKQRHKTGSTSTGIRTVLTTTKVGSRAPLLFDSDGTTFVVDNASTTSVWNYIRLFIGPLIDSNVTLETVNGNQGLSLKTVPICSDWEDDSGKLSHMSLKLLSKTDPQLLTFYMLVDSPGTKN